MDPPDPPRPPFGPPIASPFSRRKATQPLPPVPPVTCRRAVSKNLYSLSFCIVLLLLRDDCDDDDVWRSNDDDVSVVLYLFARALRRASLAFIVSISITSLSVVDEKMPGVGGCILILDVDDDDDGGDDVNALIL